MRQDGAIKGVAMGGISAASQRDRHISSGGGGCPNSQLGLELDLGSLHCCFCRVAFFAGEVDSSDVETGRSGDR